MNEQSEIKVGDTVRYTPNDILRIRGCTGEVTAIKAIEYEDGLKVDIAYVLFQLTPATRLHTFALTSLAKVNDTPPDALAAANARIAELTAERDAFYAFYRLVYGHTSEGQLMDFLRKQATTGEYAAQQLRDTVLPEIRALEGNAADALKAVKS